MITNHRQNKKRSLKQENDVCRAMIEIYGLARLQPGSGNQPGKPNDVHVPSHAFIECKETSKKQISLKWSWLEHLEKSAILHGLRTFLCIRFSEHSDTNYFLVDEQTFYHLLQCERELMK